MNRWVRRRGDDLGEWHLIPRGAKSPRGTVVAACGTSLGDDDAKLEPEDKTLHRNRCAACEDIVLRWG